MLALYDRGRSRRRPLPLPLDRHRKFRQSLAFSARSGLAWSKAQLAAGDVTGDGRGDGRRALRRDRRDTAQLLVFSGTGATLTKKTFWSGAYAAGRARLAAGDVDSDGDVRRRLPLPQPDGKGRLDVFRLLGHGLRRAGGLVRARRRRRCRRRAASASAT